MNDITIGCIIICILIIGMVAFQTVAHNNVQLIEDSKYPNPEEVAYNYTSVNLTYYRLYPSFDIYCEMESYPNTVLFSAGCIDEKTVNNDEDYIFVAEEGILQWNWYDMDTSSLPYSLGYIDEIIVTIEGMYTINDATTKIYTALAPNGLSFDEIPTELISKGQSVIFPFYQRIQYKWEYNPTKTDTYKTWEWSDIREDFQVGIGAYYNNYNNTNGELRISQMFVDIGIKS